MSTTKDQKRVIVYIDGFNLYHAIDDLRKPQLKWLNLANLGRQLLREGEVLTKVQYFTTVVDWNPDKALRHETYIAALEAKGVVVTKGNFKRSHRHCSKNNDYCPFREEKQTDVAIGVNIVADAFNDAFDRMILLTADTDQIPAVQMVLEHFPKKLVTWIAPPGRLRQAREIGDLIADRHELTPGMIGTCKLPHIVMNAAQEIVCQRPNEYA
jgi:uncharacterized LabA/DUF88 family protein